MAPHASGAQTKSLANGCRAHWPMSQDVDQDATARVSVHWCHINPPFIVEGRQDKTTRVCVKLYPLSSKSYIFALITLVSFFFMPVQILSILLQHPIHLHRLF